MWLCCVFYWPSRGHGVACVFIFAHFVSSLLSRSRFPCCPARVLPVVLFVFSLLSRFAFPCCPFRVPLSTLSVGLKISLARWCPPAVDGINIAAPSPPKRFRFSLCASISESHPASLPLKFQSCFPKLCATLGPCCNIDSF